MTYDKEILKLKRKIASLEAKASKSATRMANTHRRKFVTLAKKLGYKTVHLAYKGLFAAGGKLDELLGTTDASPKVRKRRTITPAMRKAVIAGLKAGQVAAKVAKKVGISLPSVTSIKKQAGLTKSKSVRRGTEKKVVKKTVKVRRKASKVNILEASLAQGSAPIQPEK